MEEPSHTGDVMGMSCIQENEDYSQPILRQYMARLLLVLSDVFEHGISIRHYEGVRARVLCHSPALDEELLDFHVIEDSAVLPRASDCKIVRVPSDTDYFTDHCSLWNVGQQPHFHYYSSLISL